MARARPLLLLLAALLASLLACANAASSAAAAASKPPSLWRRVLNAAPRLDAKAGASNDKKKSVDRSADDDPYDDMSRELDASPRADADAALDDEDDDAGNERLSTGITKTLIESVAVDGVVIVTWANDHYRDFAEFWCARLKSLGLQNYMVGAMDESLHARMEELKVPTWLMGSRGIQKDVVKEDFGWGSANFHRMGRDKIRLIRDFTKVEGVSVLISDIDVAWLRDPLPYFKRYPTADMLVSSDVLRSSETASGGDSAKKTTLKTIESAAAAAADAAAVADDADDDDGLDSHPCNAASNIGIMFFRPSPGSRALTDEWVKTIEADESVWDQNAFNDLKSKGGACQSSPDAHGLLKAYNGTVTLGALPVSQFGNGHTFHAQRTHSQRKKAPFAVHNTFQFGGTPGKRHRMREANAWLGDAARGYFDLVGGEGAGPLANKENKPKSGYMSYTPRVPRVVNMTWFRERGFPAATDETFPTIKSTKDELVEAHFDLVEFQLEQMKIAFAIAQALNRVLIMPPVLCGLDRAWFPHYGRFPGSRFELPFVCPLDHVVDLEKSDASKFREATFLTHPEIPEEVKRSVAIVENDLMEGSFGDAPMPLNLSYCVAGAGAGADAGGSDGGVTREREACGWFGVLHDASIVKRRALVKISGIVDPMTFEELSASIAGVRSSKVLHFTSVTPFLEGKPRSATAWSAKWKPDADKAIQLGEWCCAEDGSRKYETTY